MLRFGPIELDADSTELLRRGDIGGGRVRGEGLRLRRSRREEHQSGHEGGAQGVTRTYVHVL